MIVETIILILILIILILIIIIIIITIFIQLESTAVYNNSLKQAVSGMKLGVNNSVNSDMKRVGVRLMDGG